MSMVREEQLYAVASFAGAALAAFLVREAVHQGWQLIRGVEAPENPAARDVSWSDAILFAATTGLFVGVARVVGKRTATAGLHAYLGHKPRGVNR